jgi:nicotinamidase-related amidase
MKPFELIDAHDSALVVIDVQDFFLEKLTTTERLAVTKNIAWLIGVASKLEIPIIATAEDIPAVGGVSGAIVNKLPAGTPVLNKMTFGLTAEPEIMAAVAQTGRKTAVLVGLETDVCVAHSALGLLKAGYRVVVPADAVASPESGQQFGLIRMGDAGVLISSTKGLYYEWMRTVKASESFKAAHEDEIGNPAVGL